MAPHEDELEVKGLAYARATDLRRRATLERGRQKRDLNRGIRRLVREGKLDGIALLTGTLDETVPEYVEAMAAASSWKLGDALKVIPGIGDTKAFEVIISLHTTPTTKVGDLSWQRRQELGVFLGLVLGKKAKPKKKSNEEVQNGN